MTCDQAGSEVLTFVPRLYRVLLDEKLRMEGFFGREELIQFLAARTHDGSIQWIFQVSIQWIFQ